MLLTCLFLGVSDALIEMWDVLCNEFLLLPCCFFFFCFLVFRRSSLSSRSTLRRLSSQNTATSRYNIWRSAVWPTMTIKRVTTSKGHSIETCVSGWDEMSSWWFSSKPETQYENSLYRSIKELKCASELHVRVKRIVPFLSILQWQFLPRVYNSVKNCHNIK